MRFTRNRSLSLAATLTLLVLGAGAARAQKTPVAATGLGSGKATVAGKVTAGKTATAAAGAPKLETAAFAMGCFWCAETAFESQPGVVSAVSGYTDGHKLNPTYEEVSSGSTGHAESIQVTFDPTKTSYATLLDIFWHSIDPTQAEGQFCDHGNQYRTAIFYKDETQRLEAEKSKQAIEASHVLQAPIVTEFAPATRFWRAEEYHQDFWKKDPVRYRSYREGCGRDRRLAEIWGAAAAKPLVH